MCCTSALCYTRVFFVPHTASSDEIYVCVFVYVYAKLFLRRVTLALIPFPEDKQSLAIPELARSLRRWRKNVRRRERHWAFQVSLLDPRCPFARNGPEPPPRAFSSTTIFLHAFLPTRRHRALLTFSRKCKGETARRVE